MPSLSRPLRIAGIALVGGALTGALGLALGSGDDDCSGLAWDDFRAHLASRGATATCADFKNYVAAGVDGAGEDVDAGPFQPSQAVAERVRVPNVVGLSGSDATRVLEGAGLRVGTFVSRTGVVRSQSPEAGRSVPVGGGVSVTYVDVASGGYTYGGSNSSNQGTAGGHTYGGSNSSNQGTAGGYTYGGN